MLSVDHCTSKYPVLFPVLVTDIVGVELPEEQEPSDVDVENVVVQSLTVELSERVT